jgi:hypothetical protein
MYHWLPENTSPRMLPVKRLFITGLLPKFTIDINSFLAKAGIELAFFITEVYEICIDNRG